MVAIDNVYKTVLFLLNKENRGYITPDEFNALAKQCQTEIFEGYFKSLVQASQAPVADDYGNMMSNIEEKITIFDKTSDVLELNGTISMYPDDFYRLGVVLTDLDATHVTEVSHMDALYINKSPLTAPTQSQPVFTRHEGGIRAYPDSTEVKIVYVRIPATPIWAGATLNGQLIIDQANSQDFELHVSEEPELIVKILAYCGLIVKAQDVLQSAAAKETQIIQSEQ